MAVTALTTQTVVNTGIVPTYAAITSIPDGFTFTNTGKELLAVVNADSGPTTVSVNSLTPCSQGSDHNLSVIVASGTTQFIGPFPTSRFNDANNLVAGALTNITAITVAVIKLPN